MGKPVFIDTRKKFLRKMPKAMRKMLRRRPGVAIARFEDDPRDERRRQEQIVAIWVTGFVLGIALELSN